MPLIQRKLSPTNLSGVSRGGAHKPNRQGGRRSHSPKRLVPAIKRNLGHTNPSRVSRGAAPAAGV